MLAGQAQQVFYLKDLKLKGNWHVAQLIKPRNVYDVLEKEVVTDQNSEDAYQQDEHLTDNIVQDDSGDSSSCSEEGAVLQLNRNDIAAEEVDVATVAADLEGCEDFFDDEELEEGVSLSEYDSEDEGFISSGDSDIDS